MAHSFRDLTCRFRSIGGPGQVPGNPRCWWSAGGWCLGLLAAAMGQGPAEGALPAGMVDPVRFTVFSARPVSDLAFHPQPGAPAENLEFYATARSPRYEYRGAMPLQFLDPDGALVAEADIPTTMRDVLLLFMPATAPALSGKRSYRIGVIDDSAARHGPGGLVLINLSGLQLTGIVNRRAVILAAGSNPPIAAGPQIAMTLRTVFNGRSYQAFAHEFDLAPGERALLILFPPFYPGSLEVQSRLLRDEVEAPAGN